jgi:tRNA A-37 threonylcarbamoyl transferase component Bud32
VPIDPPDSDDFDWDPDLENASDLDPELERELARFAAERAAKLPSPVRLTPELEELEGKIADVEVRRNIHGDGIAPFMLGRFEAITTMRGGMGLVIKARDPQLEREVAIKLWMRSGPEAQEALLAEAKTLAKLKHPNVVTIYEPGVFDGRVYFVMEWIDGVDGHDWMDEPRFWREVREVYVAAGTGLAAAHDAAIQHRDFKPSNILIGNDGRVVVADFGVADSLHAIPDLDEPDKIVGTPSYMAPERLDGQRGDARSDQFSFCVAMWRALYRQRPFAGETGEELRRSIERGEISEAPGVDVPLWLSKVVRKGLADDPEQRYRDMHELLNALRDEPPPDETATNDEPIDHLVVEAAARVLHRSTGSSARKPSRGVFFVALAVVCALVLLGTLAETSLLVETKQPEVEPTPLPAHPCAGVDRTDPNVNVNSVVHEVCRLIRDDHLKAAMMLWEREYFARESVGRTDVVLGEDTLIVAGTFVEHAEALETKDPSSAEAAAENGLAWMSVAAAHLGHEEPRVRGIKVRAERIIANVTRGD